MKYLHGIGNKNGGFFNCLGLFVLYPDTNNKIDFYQWIEFENTVLTFLLSNRQFVFSMQKYKSRFCSKKYFWVSTKILSVHENNFSRHS